jgi:hypothetical protein
VTCLCGHSTVARYGGQTNTELLTYVICSYIASHRSHSGGTLLSEIREFPKLCSSMAWLVPLV